LGRAGGGNHRGEESLEDWRGQPIGVRCWEW
jgi:hypothetical protein